MLFVFGGLPASGKSVLSLHLAKNINAVHIRVDSIEQHLKTHAQLDPVGVAGYVSAYAVAMDNLRLGRTVIADSVNPIQVTRNAWRQVAADAGSSICEIEVICSDLAEHEQRYSSRSSDIEGLKFGPWKEVLNREYENWETRDILIDTAGQSVENSQTDLLQKIERHGMN